MHKIYNEKNLASWKLKKNLKPLDYDGFKRWRIFFFIFFVNFIKPYVKSSKKIERKQNKEKKEERYQIGL